VEGEDGGMPLVTDYSEVKEIYQEAAERGIALPAFCSEDRETVEAILAAAKKMGEKIGREDVPIVPAWTIRYPDRGQMTLVTASGDPVLGTRLMLSDLAAMTSGTSPYRKLRVLPHLDHGFPWLDSDVMESLPDSFASIMCDASEKPFDENVRITAAYAERVRGRVLVEGAVDEIFAAGGVGKNEPSTVAQADRFLKETGVDIIVPNVGTEHRSTGDQVRYNSSRAREISAKVGKVLCLHGTSSVVAGDLPGLPRDGFVKINVYTTLAVHGGQAVARQVLETIGDMFGEAELRRLVKDGLLGERVLSRGPFQPKLASVANPPRRDAWFAAVRDRCVEYLLNLGYERYAS
jgi:fructose/tagatose bisphosphate aldolase